MPAVWRLTDWVHRSALLHQLPLGFFVEKTVMQQEPQVLITSFLEYLQGFGTLLQDVLEDLEKAS